MKPNEAGTQVPQWLLERVALDELPPEQLEAARARIASEPEGPERLAALEAENAALLEQHRPGDVAAEIRRRAHLANVAASHPKHRARLPSWGLAIAAVTAVALVVVAIPSAMRVPGAETNTQDLLADGSRSKSGGPRLLVHLRDDRVGATLLADADVVKPGDVLQLSYQAEGKAFGAIFSLDGRGVVTRHLPETGTSAARLEPKGTVSLPFAYALDDAPAFERFFLVTSDRPFEVEAVRRAIERTSGTATPPPALPPGLSLHTLLLRKSTP